MPANLSNLLSRLSANQLSTLTFEAGLDTAQNPVADSFAHYLNGAASDVSRPGAQALYKVGFYNGSTSPSSTDYFTDAAKNNAWQALQLWSGLTGVTFIYVSDVNQANVAFTHYGDTFGGETPKKMGAGTKFSTESTAPTGIGGVSFIKTGIIQIDNTTKNTDGSLSYGDIGSYTVSAGSGVGGLVHEVGHLLGLGHTGSYNGTVDPSTQQRNAYDDLTWSVMSYIEPTNNTKPDPTDPNGKRTVPSATNFPTNPVGANYQFTSGGFVYNDAPFTPMGLDLFAAQRLDGSPALSTFAGGKTFGFNSNITYKNWDGTTQKLSMYDFSVDTQPVVTLFDYGSNNTLDLSGDGTNLRVDLNDGTFSDSAGMKDNLFIEYGTHIDHAIGGDGNDTFILNARSDVVDGGKGSNTAVFSGNRSDYVLSFAGSTVVLTKAATGTSYRLSNIQTYQFADGTVASLSDLPRATWKGPAGGHFGIAANWSNGQVPVSTSEVRIGAGASVVVTQQDRNVVDSLVLEAGADLDLTTGQFIVSNDAAGTVVNGTLEAEAGTTLFLGGALTNTGTIFLYGGTLQTSSPSVTLIGGGTLNMQGGAIGGRDASGSPLAYDTFTNVDNLIQGSGTIGRAGLLFPLNFVNGENANVVASTGTLRLSGAITNAGILGASDNGTLDLSGVVDGTGGGRVVALGVNARVLLDGGTVTGGSLTAAGSSVIEVGANETLSGVTLFGSVVVDAGSKLTLTGDIYADGATIDATAGQIDLSAAHLHGGTVKLPVNQPLNGLVLDGGTGGINLSGAVIKHGETVTVLGSIINTTAFTIAGNAVYGDRATLAVSGTAKLSGGGTVALRDLYASGGNQSTTVAAIIGATGADTLENVDNTIDGYGQLGLGLLSFSNDASGVVNVTGSSLRLWTVSASNTGLMEATGGTLVIETAVNNAGGTILASGHTVQLGGEGRAATIVAGTLSSAATTTGVSNFLVDGSGAVFDGSGAAVNAQGLVDVAHGATLTVKGLLANSGAIQVDGNAVYGDRASLAVSGAVTLQGGGTVLLRDLYASGGNQSAEAAGIAGASATDVLTNVDNVISGYGRIGQGKMSLVNKGTINATSSTLTLDTGTSVIVNTGGLRGEGGNLVINSPLITGALVTSSAGGTVTFRNSVTNSGGLQFEAGGKVVLDGGILAGTGFMSTNASTSLEVTTNGTIDGTSQNVQLDGATGVDHGATLTLKGKLTNKGALSLDGNAVYGDRASLAVSGAVTLQGGGTVVLRDLYASGGNQSAEAAGIAGASATDVLTNVDNVISGYGRIGQGKMSLVNKGTINATSSTLTLDTGTSVIVNTGGLRGEGGNLVINSPLITGALVTSSAGGTVTFRNSVTNSGGLQFEAGGKVVLDGGILAGTGFMSTNASTSLEVTTNGTIDGTSQNVQLDGATGVDHGATLTLKGKLTNKGALSLDGNAVYGDRASLAVSGAVTLQGGGTVVLRDLYASGGNQSAEAAGIAGASATDVLTNVDNVISGYGRIGQGKMSLVNKGTINATSSTLTLDTGTSPIDNSGLLLAGGGVLAIRSNVVNSGQVRADTGSTVTVGSLIRNNGSVTAADGGTVVLDGGTLTGSGTFGSSALGKIEVGQGGGYIIQALSQTVSLAGSLVVDHGGRLVLSGTIRNTGAASLDGNAVYGDQASLAVLGAVTLQGGGTVLLHDLYASGGNKSASVAVITGTSATDVLDNVDNVISGYGLIGQGTMSLVNEAGGTIKATASTLTLDAGAGSINNKGALLADGGALTLSSAVANTGLIEARSGTVTLAQAATGALQVDAGGTLVLQGGAVVGTSIAFTGATGTLKLAGPASATVNATITGFVDGDTLDLVGLAATGAYNGGVLTLQSGGAALGSLVFAGAAATDVFTTSADGQGGTKITRSTQGPTPTPTPTPVPTPTPTPVPTPTPTPVPTPTPTPVPTPTPTPVPTPTPTPVPTPTPTPTPTAAVSSIGQFLSDNLPSGSLGAAALAVVTTYIKGLTPSGSLGVAAFVNGGIAASSAQGVSAAVAANPTAGSSLALPSGYGILLATGGGPVTLSDAGKGGALVIGNAAGDTLNSTGLGATLVGGQGGNTFNVSGGATIVTGDGQNTVKATGAAAVQVTTGTGTSTVVLAGGTSTVASNGQDTVFGGSGAATVTAAKGLVAIGGAGLMTFIGGSAASVVFGGKGGLNFTGGSAFDVVVGVGGPLNAQAGSGGGEFFGNAGGDTIRSGSAQTIMVASNGGRLISTGAAGNYLVAGAGTATLDGSAATGNDVFFGGTGQDAILLGSGTDLVGTGTGTSTVQLGSGSSTVFAFGRSTISSGTGSASIVMGGTVALNIASGAARSFALFNFVPGTDKISLSGYGGSTVANALATQVNAGGQTVLTLSDSTRIQLIGLSRADANLFG